jgi:O-acetyl-ADP-ribose deacetylase (regulator of RNase III)
MAIKVHILDLNGVFIEECKAVFSGVETVTCTQGDIRSMDSPDVAYVSPSNSLMFMDGGIDFVYSRHMFQGVEAKLKHKVKQLGFTTFLGRSYLPVGSAIIEDHVGDGVRRCALIAAPTMFLPHNVSETRNAYHAFRAALSMFDKYNKTSGCGTRQLHTLVCPALCTGYGKMPPIEAARQMRLAYDHHTNGPPIPEMTHGGVPWCFIGPNQDQEQPNVFDNREIKEISVEHILRS